MNCHYSFLCENITNPRWATIIIDIKHVIIRKYKKLKLFCEKHVKIAKERYHKSYFEKHKNNSRKQWQMISTLLGRKRKK